jgi:hypothetical protein
MNTMRSIERFTERDAFHLNQDNYMLRSKTWIIAFSGSIESPLTEHGPQNPDTSPGLTHSDNN